MLAVGLALTFAIGAVGEGDCRQDGRVTMGCTATVRACGAEAGVLQAAVAAALDEIDRLDALLSNYRRDSPLSRVNREAALGPVAVEPELFDFVALCLRWSRESDGAFDATVGPLMRAWGFFRGEGRVPDEAELRRAREAVGYRHVVLDPVARTVRFDRPGVELDPGGLGKGYAVDRAVEVLRRRGIASALVNLGGSSVYGLGGPPGGTAWQVAVRAPGTDRVALTVRLRDRALSVAGTDQRFFEQDGVRYGHVMDPRTGLPAQGVLAVAVLSDSATDGDALDDVLLVEGAKAARTRVGKDASLGALLFLPDRGRSWRLLRLGMLDEVTRAGR
ncbi:MAG TPA: FAD:protein FMN transferase [Vicinamibacteria bacterium]|nr:FAD:protein FMN transferase [Vicinamibacteria bacterium]